MDIHPSWVESQWTGFQQQSVISMLPLFTNIILQIPRKLEVISVKMEWYYSAVVLKAIDRTISPLPFCECSYNVHLLMRYCIKIHIVAFRYIQGFMLSFPSFTVKSLCLIKNLLVFWNFLLISLSLYFLHMQILKFWSNLNMPLL